MTTHNNRDSPRRNRRGPVVETEHRLILQARHGVLEPGYLSEYYRPFPPNAHVVLDCGTSHLMQTYTAETIGRALAHCERITVTGTADRSQRGYVDRYGLICGLDAIANVISTAAAHATEMQRK
ncbi:hypothetical protein ACFWBR_35030 [Streptomyces sp. NPDC060006]|uniref:hypothetical protein n=1 Tax=unclassified Streptomyces TaxID=2593676 RepID=UPI0036B9A327